MQTEAVCQFVDKETNESYPLAHRLNRLAHLCISILQLTLNFKLGLNEVCKTYIFYVANILLLILKASHTNTYDKLMIYLLMNK
jgi:hypothetical protein